MLTSTALKTLSRTTMIRHSSSTAKPVSTTFLTMGKKETFSKNWLQDSSVYPLFAALGGAVALCIGVGVHFLANNKDVRIASAKKRATIRDW